METAVIKIPTGSRPPRQKGQPWKGTRDPRRPRIVIIIPCLNEELTVGKVVRDFKEAIPYASIHVFDNASTDRTSQIAASSGAIVHYVPVRGKGMAVREAFRTVKADVYVIVDGDDTYPASMVHRLIEPVLSGRCHMAIGDRLSSGAYDAQNTRSMHGGGNRLVRWLINSLFRADLKDILTGYRAMSRDFVRNMPVISNGFELETEFTLYALDRRYAIREIPISYGARPAGSQSKLSTVRDGIRVLRTVWHIFKDYRPLAFFTSVAGVLAVVGLAIGSPVIIEFLQTGLVTRIPSAILATGLEIFAALSFACGVLLDSILRHQKETKALLQRILA